MRVVIDMNLSPRWVDHLREAGHEAVHWSSMGAADASDEAVMEWARDHGHVILTSDLDFGVMLAMTGAPKPSVIQLRAETTLPDRIGPLVVQAIERARDDLRAGALLTVETGRPRLRILPFDREG